MSFGQWRGWTVSAALALLVAGTSCAPEPTHPGADGSQSKRAEARYDERAIPVGLLATSVLPSGVPLEADDVIWGSSDAPATLVAFLDYECPFSARALPTLRQLQEIYGPKRLRIVLKHLPLDFHPNALPAAVALQAVRELGGHEAAYAYAVLLLENQHQLDEESLASMAVEVGVNATEFRSRLAAQHLSRAVENDIGLAVELGINGTPTFRINGAPLVGAQPVGALREVIDRELEGASQLAQQGVSSREIYPARVAANQASGDDRERDPVYRVPVGDSPELGPADALVTIVEFSEFQCPFCERVLPALKKLRERFPRDVRIVFKHLPLDFHDRALPAARLAAAIFEKGGNDAFWSAYEQLFEGSLDDEHLLAVARAHGLSAELANTAIHERAGQDVVERDLNLADDLGARGTPHFFVNGKRLVGARPYAEFEQAVLEALKAAKPVLEQGVSASEYYEHLMSRAEAASGPMKTSVAVDSKNHPSLGPENAPVTVHVFSDFECPYCARVEPTLRELRERFPERVRIVWHNLPLGFHEHARPAAAAALEAFAQKGNAAFWKMHEGLFASHASGEGPELDRQALLGHARALGLDVERFEKALDDGRHEAALKADMALARDAGIDGTPGFVINGWMTTGARPLRYFSALVERALEEHAAQAH